MMTGKNKENFEKWLNTFLLNDENAHLVNTDSFGNNYSQIDIFYEYKFEMQLGVYLEYFNSIGCYAEHIFEYKGCKAIMNGDSLGLFNTMNEAYTEAFKKADEIANLTLK